MNQELLKKINDAIDETFVGNYIFTEEEQAEMLEELSRSFSYVCNTWGESLSPLQYNLTFVTLVNLTKQWHANEDTWLDFLYKKLLGKQSLEDEPTGKAYRLIKDVYDSLTKKNKVFYFDSFTKKYYAAITSHAMAPKSSFFSFFDMCWGIYCEDLNQDYVINDSAFTLVAQSLKNKLGGKIDEDEDLKIGSKAYALRASIKGLIMDRPEIFISLLDDTICSIHSLFNSEPIKKDTYLHSIIVEWWLEKEKKFGTSKGNSKSRREKIITDYSQIRAKYIIEDSVVKLYIPAFRLLSEFEYEPYIEIKSNGNLVFSQEITTTGSGILMGTKPLEVDLNDLALSNLDDIKVIITHSGKVIYDSKATLNRDFILLSDKKEIVAQDCLPDNYYLYVNSFSNLIRYPDDIQRISPKTFSLNALDGEVLQSKNRTVFFITEQTNRELYLFAREMGDILFRQNGEDFKIIDGDLYVDIISSMDAKEYGVRYNEASFRLIDFSGENLDERVRYNISKLLDVGEPQRICVFRYSDNSIISAINLVKFNNIHIEFDRPYYYGKDVIGNARFKTEKYDVSVNFNASDEEIFIPIENGEVFIKPPTIRWKIDDGLWRFSPLETPVWHKKHNNSSILKVNVPKNLTYSLGLGNHFLTSEEKTSEYNLGRLLYSLKETDSQDELPLFLKIENELLLLETIAIKEKFIDDPITVNSEGKKITWNPEYFIGDDSSQFEIRFYRNDKFLAKVSCDNSQKKIYSVSSFNDDYYEVELIYLPKGFVKKEISYLRKKCVFGDEKIIRFRNKMLTLKQVMILGASKEETIRPLHINNLKYLGQIDERDIYSGELFFINHNTGMRTPVKSMKDDKGQYIQINPLRIELRTNNTCYIGYGLIEDDEDFEYDGEFAIDRDGKISLSMKTNGMKNKCVNYYLMEVKKDV